MEYDIVELEAFQVCGLGLDCPNDDTSGIDALWDRFLARAGEVAGSELYGVSHGNPGGFYHVAGAKVAGEPAVPEGMELTAVPGGRYMRVAFDGDPQKIARTFDALLDEVIPQAGLRAAEPGCCLEAYPEDSWNPETSTMKLDLLVRLEQ